MTERRQPPVRGFGRLAYCPPVAEALAGGTVLRTVGGGSDDVTRLTLCFAGGSAVEVLPLQALCAMQMLTEGTATRSAEQVAEQYDYLGVNAVMQSCEVYCDATFTAVSRHYGAALDLTFDCLLHPVFGAAEWAVLQRRLRPILAQICCQPKTVAACEMQRLLYGDGHPLAAGLSPDYVDALRPDLLRQYYWANVTSGRCHAVLSGRVDEAALRLTRERLCALPHGDSAPVSVLRARPAAAGTSRTLHVADAVQAALVFALPLPDLPYDDLLSLRVLVTALGGYFGSRLMQNIREEKGYTYSIGAGIDGNPPDRFLRISTECDCGYVEAVQAEVRAEVLRLRREPLPEGELETVRQYLLGEYAKMLDHPFKQAALVAAVVNGGLPADHFDRAVAAVLSATPVRLRQLAEQYLDPDALFTVVATR